MISDLNQKGFSEKAAQISKMMKTNLFNNDSFGNNSTFNRNQKRSNYSNNNSRQYNNNDSSKFSKRPFKKQNNYESFNSTNTSGFSLKDNTDFSITSFDRKSNFNRDATEFVPEKKQQFQVNAPSYYPSSHPNHTQETNVLKPMSLTDARLNKKPQKEFNRKVTYKNQKQKRYFNEDLQNENQPPCKF